jgi:hypothetical protein
MRIHTEKQHKYVTADMTPTRSAVIHLGRKLGDVGHKLYMAIEKF